MNITIKTIPHSKQRYQTVGDWIWQGDNLIVFVSNLGNWKREALVGIHEVIEALLCKSDGVTTEQVNHFDFDFEKNRQEGNLDEPGDSIRAPYYKQHQIATAVEKIMAAEMDVDWNLYNTQIEEL